MKEKPVSLSEARRLDHMLSAEAKGPTITALMSENIKLKKVIEDLCKEIRTYAGRPTKDGAKSLCKAADEADATAGKKG